VRLLRLLGVARPAAASVREMVEELARGMKVPGRVRVAIETTAGSGTALGSTFEELRDLADLMPRAARRRVAYCADTCHLWAAGYDLVGDYDGVLAELDRVLGLERLVCFHLTDSRGERGGRLDRHALIGEGTLGREPFRRVMTDPRLAHVIKVLETPKGDDMVINARRMLRRLRAYARGPRPARRTLRADPGFC
jgi:deoxyribonuclease-4